MIKPKIHFEKVPLEVVLKIANATMASKKEERPKAAVGKNPVRKSEFAAVSLRGGQAL
jgi:hypothetical protein